MYIDPFWAGVGVTLLTESGLLIVAVVRRLWKERKR